MNKQTLLFPALLMLTALAWAAPPQHVINLGTLPLKSTKDTVFQFSTGDKSLIIKSVKVNCTCTKVQWSKQPLKPNTNAVIKISYVAKDAGVFYKTITITTSDPAMNRDVVVRGQVQ